MVCAAVEGSTEKRDGEFGVPLAEVVLLPTDFSFAVDDGIGKKLCPGVGFAGSRGGALRLFLGNVETGGECSTSLCVNTDKYRL